MVRTPGIGDAIRGAAPGFEVDEVAVAGPPTSCVLRAGGWAEALVLLAAVTGPPVRIRAPSGGAAGASVEVDATGWPVSVRVEVACGDPLDDVVLRSYATGAAHMALGWVCREGISVDPSGLPQDLTVRSFGILRAGETPPIDVRIDRSCAHLPPVNGSDAVFAAVAAATWLAQGLPQDWPTRRERS